MTVSQPRRGVFALVFSGALLLLLFSVAAMHSMSGSAVSHGAVMVGESAHSAHLAHQGGPSAAGLRAESHSTMGDMGAMCLMVLAALVTFATRTARTALRWETARPRLTAQDRCQWPCMLVWTHPPPSLAVLGISRT